MSDRDARGLVRFHGSLSLGMSGRRDCRSAVFGGCTDIRCRACVRNGSGEGSGTRHEKELEGGERGNETHGEGGGRVCEGVEVEVEVDWA